MSRCFRVLGLTEHATKAQVEEAYRKRVARYKGPDYQEEPEYANRKLMELRGAYEEALRLAGSSKSSTSTRNRSSSKVLERTTESTTAKSASKPSSAKSLRHGEGNDEEHVFREKFHQWMEKRDDEKIHRKNQRANDSSKIASTKSSKKTGKQKLSDKFPELKKLNKENLKSAWDEFKSDAAGLAGSAFDDDGFDPFAEDREAMERTAKETTENHGERLTENGTVERPKKESLGGEALVKLIVSLIIIVVASFGSCEDDSVSYEDYDYVDESGVEYVYDYIDNYGDLMELDRHVQEIAEGSASQLFMEDGYGSAQWAIDTDEELRPVADDFAKKYWGMESIEEVTDYLHSEFVDYLGDSSMTLDQQLNYIFPFYGFLPVDEAQWYENPYTGDRIKCFADYLEYLNQYYDETQ